MGWLRPGSASPGLGIWIFLFSMSLRQNIGAFSVGAAPLWRGASLDFGGKAAGSTPRLAADCVEQEGKGCKHGKARLVQDEHRARVPDEGMRLLGEKGLHGGEGVGRDIHPAG